MRTWGILTIVLLNLFGCSSVPNNFSPQQPISPATFTHQDFHKTLEQHVNDGVVNYQALASDSSFSSYSMILNTSPLKNFPH